MAERTCAVEACEKNVMCRGWCSMHYQRWRRYGDLNEVGRRVVRPNGLRRCSTCKEEKGRSEFNRNARRPDGLTLTCKPCTRAAGRASYARHRDKRRSENAAWRKANADRVREANRLRRAENRERSNAYARAWARRNPDKVLANTLLRVALKRGATGGERVRSADVFERDRWICQLCGEPINPGLRYPDPMSASIDHVVPVTRGGQHTYDNVQAAHLDCNRRKSNF